MRKQLRIGNRSWQVDLLEKDPVRVRITEDEEDRELMLSLDGRGSGRISIGGRYFSYFVTLTVAGVWVTLAGETFFFEKGRGDREGVSAEHGGFSAPMPGKIIQVRVETGQTVQKGDVLVVLEAMKMEHRIEAPENGTVAAIHCKEGAVVNQGFNLLDFEAESESGSSKQ